VWPSCFPDINGQVFLRGHITVSPVPAVGGILLGLFPEDDKGVCACTPVPDPGTHSNSVIATTTAISYPANKIPEVCIVRLLIGVYLPFDVNSDLVINATDIFLVDDSPYFSNDEVVPVNKSCPYSHTLQRVDCGPADVNLDGRVSSLDSLSITNSAGLGVSNVSLPIPCGGVYATAFSCGSTRQAPLVPAVEVSFDSIVYFDNDGVFGAVTPTTKRDADSSLIRNVLVDFEHLRGEITSLRSEVDTKFVAHDAKVNTIESQVVRHERSLRGAVPVNQREILAGASVAVAGVVLCGIVVYVIAKRR
jgi:hypothetical protein